MDIKNQYNSIGKDYIKGQKEYFSKTFFREFDVKEIIEEEAPEEYMLDKGMITPGFLGIMAIKR